MKRLIQFARAFMLLAVLKFTGGVVAMFWGGTHVTRGSIMLAHQLGVRPIGIGLTVVAIATSMPEVLVAVIASLYGEPALAIGTAVGSNIVNIGLLLGLAALIRPIPLRTTMTGWELPMLLAVTLLGVSLFLDRYVSRVDGAVLLFAALFLLHWLVRIVRMSDGCDKAAARCDGRAHSVDGRLSVRLRLVLGFLALLVGAEFIVSAVPHLAAGIGVTDVVIGVGLIAVGTSLPELTVAIVSAYKGEFGLMIGSIVGSNAFNTSAVIGIATLLQPVTLTAMDLTSHVLFMAAFTLVLFVQTRDSERRTHITRAEGMSMLVVYVLLESFTVAPKLT